MITKEKLAALKGTKYNNDPLLREVFESLEDSFQEIDSLKKSLEEARWRVMESKDRTYP